MSNLSRCFAACIVTLGLAGPSWVHAQVTKIIVPYEPGGATDIVARLLASNLPSSGRQPTIVENRPGAQGMIGIGQMAKAKPDGMTLAVDSPGVAMNPSLFKSVPYDPLKDIQPIAQITTSPFVIVSSPSFPVSTLAEMLAHIKNNPGKVNMAQAGPASRMAAALLNLTTGIDVMFVPFKGATPAITATMAGDTQIMIQSLSSLSAQITSGRLRPLAVTSTNRARQAPTIPTTSEAGLPNYVVTIWTGIFAQKGMKTDQVISLNAQVNDILKLPEVKAKIDSLGAEPVSSSVDAFTKFYLSEVTRWKTVSTQSKIELE